jgi:hypothetical protein
MPLSRGQVAIEKSQKFLEIGWLPEDALPVQAPSIDVVVALGRILLYDISAGHYALKYTPQRTDL